MVRKRARQDIPVEVDFEKEETVHVAKANAAEAGNLHNDDEPSLSSNIELHKLSSARFHPWVALLLGILFIAILKFSCMSSASRAAPVHYTCPTRIATAANDIPTENDEYERVTNQIKTNFTQYMQTFRNSSFDSWGRTYDKVKQGMYHWKSTKFAPHLENGNSVYESACGIGMNLFLTLEILYEVKGIKSLVVYGNEYVSASAQVANAVFDHHETSFHAVKGTICPGDSANLDHVPPNWFDLVYTGYITPINDPLHVNKGDMKKNIEFYRKACEGSDRQSQKLSELAQRAQEDFYGKWVAEMVRIAKPGKPVIVEQVSMPICDEKYDWGGVAREWWEPAISRYGWDIDPSSMEMEKDTIFHNRYHVFMRKNAAR